MFHRGHLQGINQFISPGRVDPFYITEGDAGEVELIYGYVRGLDIDSRGISLELMDKGAEQ